jgi:hypothetical protein
MLAEQDARLPYSTPKGVDRNAATPPATALKEAVVRWLLALLQAPAPAVAIEEHREEPSVADTDWPSLDEVYEQVKDRLAAQNDRVKTIDTKANFGLVAATLLTAGVTGLGKALVESGQKAAIPRWTILGIDIRADRLVDWVTVVSLGAFALAAVSAFMAYRVREFRESPNLKRLLDHYLNEDPRFTKAAILNQRARDYEFNEAVIASKLTWTLLAMLFLVVESILLVIIALIQVFWL